MTGASGSEFERLLANARAALETMRTGDAPGGPGAPAAETEPLEGVGEAAHGRIKATVLSGGKLKGIELEPRVLRMGSEELGEQITQAVNAAFDDLRAKAAEAGAVQGVDLARLSEQVREMQDEGLRQMDMFNQSIADVMARLHGNRG